MPSATEVWPIEAQLLNHFAKVLEVQALWMYLLVGDNPDSEWVREPFTQLGKHNVSIDSSVSSGVWQFV